MRRPPGPLLLLALSLLTTGIAGCVGGDGSKTDAATTPTGALLTIPPSLVGWAQDRGGPGSPGTARLPDAPLDVLRAEDLLREDRIGDNRPRILGTPHGLTTLAVEAGVSGPVTCTPVRLEDPESDFFEPFGGAAECLAGGDLASYAASTDEILVCTDGDAAGDLLQGWDAGTGEKRWGIRPDLEGALILPGVMDYNDWSCDDVAIDEDRGRYYVSLVNEAGDHILQARDLRTQDLLWDSRSRSASVWYHETTLSSSGLVVHGDIAQGRGGVGHAIAWYSLEGQAIGQLTTAEVCGGQDRVISWSDGSAARGNLIAMVHCDELILIDPEVPQETRVPLEPRQASDRERGIFPSLGLMAPPAWSPSTLAVPRDDVLFLFKSTDLTAPAATWRGSPGSIIQDVVIAGDVAHMIVSAPVGSSRGDDLVTLQLATGHERQRTPLPMEGLDRLTPWGSGLMAWDPGGSTVVLGPADASLVPVLKIQDAYPRVGEPVGVATDFPAGPPARLLVAWGDGLVESLEPGDPIERIYIEAGDVVLRVTAVYEDDRTATAETTLFVGEDPPQNLNAIQTAFAPEHQDLTFGVLGIAVALAGGLIALGRRRRSRGILQRELEAIDRAVELAGEDPTQQEAVLQERRAHVKGLLVDGALDEAQYVVLERHIDELAQGLRIGLLEEELPFLPIGMARALQSMLSDGRISAWERDRFLDGLDAEGRLSSEEREAVRGLVEAWFSRDVGGVV